MSKRIRSVKPKLILGLDSLKKAYNLNYYYGFATLKRTAHEYIDDTAEIRRVADSLNRLADILDSSHNALNRAMTQEEWLVLLSKSIVDKLIRSAMWDFNPRQELFVSGRVNETPAVRSGTVVYFLTHPDFPKSVKIGSTDDVLLRTWQLMHEFNLQTPFTLETMIHIDKPYHRELEFWLHTHLKDHKIGGEFYSWPIVKQMIDTYKPKLPIVQLLDGESNVTIHTEL